MSEDEVARARRARANKQLAERVMSDLGGPSPEQLAEILGAAPKEIASAIAESLERDEAYHALDRDHAKMDEAEGLPADRCCNMVCAHYRQNEGYVEVTSTSEFDGKSFKHLVPKSKRANFCAGGAERAQQCMFRMTEHPPSNPFVRLPSWAEAVRMLQRNGLLEPDEFGHYNGTDFAQQRNTRKLWFSYIKLLVETGKIPSFPYEHEGEVLHDVGQQGDAARDFLLSEAKK